MERCWNKTKIVIICFASMGVLCGAIAIFYGVYWTCSTYGGWFNYLFCAPYVVFAIWLMKCGIMTYIVTIPKYSIDKYGIDIKYLVFNKKRYEWREISEISVCDIHHDTKSSNCDFVIRIVIGEEPAGPQNKKCPRTLFGYEKWRTESYIWKHWKQLLIIEYTEEKYIKIKEASGMEIKDYRMVRSSAWKIKVPK